jgi:hypothetical protein
MDIVTNIVESPKEMIINEIKLYEKFPNDYRHCIFSHHAYHYGGESTPHSFVRAVIFKT